jgi:hypothetical protein
MPVPCLRTSTCRDLQKMGGLPSSVTLDRGTRWEKYNANYRQRPAYTFAPVFIERITSESRRPHCPPVPC